PTGERGDLAGRQGRGVPRLNAIASPGPSPQSSLPRDYLRVAQRGEEAELAQPLAGCTGALPDFTSAIQASVRASSTSSGSAPPPRISSWKERMSNLSPNSFLARSRSSRIFSWPIL